MLAPREAAPDERVAARARLDAVGVSCAKLMVSASACHGCGDNPAEAGGDPDARLAERFAWELGHIGALHDAVRMGLVRGLEEMDPWEWEMLRVYWWQAEALRLNAGAPHA